MPVAARRRAIGGDGRASRTGRADEGDARQEAQEATPGPRARNAPGQSVEPNVVHRAASFPPGRFSIGIGTTTGDSTPSLASAAGGAIPQMSHRAASLMARKRGQAAGVPG